MVFVLSMVLNFFDIRVISENFGLQTYAKQRKSKTKNNQKKGSRDLQIKYDKFRSLQTTWKVEKTLFFEFLEVQKSTFWEFLFFREIKSVILFLVILCSHHLVDIRSSMQD